ncbi:MAG: erythromycin esterase family protein [Actinomycetota bacterium]|nr:erythromycin esterase family protein [Actinomycetota bacterium]
MDDVTALAGPLRDRADLDPLLERVGDARVVMLGEASHGTSEYYRWRAEVTRRLLTEKGFSFVAVEGDWPDCYEVNRCVKSRPGAPDDPRQVLDGFSRWPTWMWANDEVVDFARWLRRHNDARPSGDRAGFYGLDVYSLWDSLRELLDYLREHEPEHVEQAAAAFRCFEPYGEDPQEYALATRFVPTSCESTVVELLGRLCSERGAPVDGDDPEARFAAEQNAAVARDAERYYRAMVRGGGASWNVRDVHMADTLDRLLEFHGPGAKAVVWEHNTHIGDARATDMVDAGMTNLGQLGRERHGTDDVVLVGFGGYRGTVVAAERWGAPLKRMPVPPAREHSLERLLHEQVGRDALFVFPPADDSRPAWLTEELPHRAIGVVYDPRAERWGNYVPTVLGARYDAFLYFDDTHALRPLHAEPSAEGEEDTYPWAV